MRKGGPAPAAPLRSPCCCCASAGCWCPATDGRGGGGGSGSGSRLQGCSTAGEAAPAPPCAAGWPPACAMPPLQTGGKRRTRLVPSLVHIVCLVHSDGKPALLPGRNLPRPRPTSAVLTQACPCSAAAAPRRLQQAPLRCCPPPALQPAPPLGAAVLGCCWAAPTAAAAGPAAGRSRARPPSALRSAGRSLQQVGSRDACMMRPD